MFSQSRTSLLIQPAAAHALPPARARQLLARGRAVPYHIKGLFDIRLLHRTRAESAVQDVALNIDPGTQTAGIVITTGDPIAKRIVLAALEIKHRASAMKATHPATPYNNPNALQYSYDRA